MTDSVAPVQVREVPVAETRPLRQSVLRSHETIEQVAADEPAKAFAAGGFDGVRVFCNARVPARSFYERAGFHACSEVFELPPIGPHLVMERELP